MAAAQKTEGLMYKGHPLRRIGNMIYYGSMADPYIILMQVRESKKYRTWMWQHGSLWSFSLRPRT